MTRIDYTAGTQTGVVYTSDGEEGTNVAYEEREDEYRLLT